MRLLFFLVAFLVLIINVNALETAREHISKFREKVFVSLKQGEPDSAQYWAKEGLLYLKKNKVSDSLLMAKQYNFLAYVEGLLDHKLEAINFTDSAILLLETSDTITSDLLYSYQKKGQTYQQLGDFYRANVALKMALHLTDTLNKPKGGVLNDLGTNELHIGNLDKAEVYFKALVADSETEQWLKLIGFANLTDLYLDKGNIAKAQTTWNEVERYLETDGVEESPLLPDFLQIRAHLQNEKGNHQQAIETLRRAIDILEKQELENRKLGKFRSDLVLLLLEEDLQLAKIECLKVYEYFTTQKGLRRDPYEMVATHLMAQVFYQQYEESNEMFLLDSCIQYCRKAQEIATELRSSFLYRNSKYLLASYLKGNTALGIDAANELIEEKQIKKGHALLFYFMELGKSQILLDEQDEKRRASLKAKDLLDKLYVLELRRFESRDSIERIELSMQIENLKNNLKDETSSSLEERLYYSDLAELKRLSKQTNTVFLEFGEGREEVSILMIKEGQTFSERVFVSKDSLESLVLTHLSNLKNPNTSLSDYRTTAYLLYKALLEPLSIEQENVVIIPSGLIANLPFSSLVTEKSPTTNFKRLSYAINKWDFSYVLSSTFLLDQTGAKKSFCAMLPTNQLEGDLSSHERLLNGVANEFNGAYFKNERTFSLFTNIEEYDFIHISSHGTFSKEDPIQSYLFLPGSDTSKLSLEQLYITNTSNNPFIVLNACEVGEGELKKGEGIDNFTRAFFYAGASGLIESSWKINAEQTAAIFNDFYDVLLEGKQTKEALREAQLRYLKNQNTDHYFAHPYYWAGFKHFGSAVLLEASYSKTIYWGIGGLGIGFAVLIFAWRYLVRRKE